jgi:hypothetical protein
MVGKSKRHSKQTSTRRKQLLMLYLLLVVLCLSLPRRADAEEQTGWRAFSGLEMGLLKPGATVFSRKVAAAGGFSQSSFALTGLDFELRFYHLVNTAFDFGFVSPDDYAPFSNDVICELGCETQEVQTWKSQFRGVSLSASMGLATPPIAIGDLAFTLGCNLGVHHVALDRSIFDCSDCDSASFALGGRFVTDQPTAPSEEATAVRPPAEASSSRAVALLFALRDGSALGSACL